MKIKLENGQPASEEAIQALESALGFRLCDSFREFVRKDDGAEPDRHRFNVGNYTGSSVRQFIPVDEILEERTHLDELPAKAYPIAYDSCGNYIFIDEGKNGAVFFLDHEEMPDGITELAPNFTAFLDIWEPKAEPILLEPDQVKRVWVDPEFQKRLQKEAGPDGPAS